MTTDWTAKMIDPARLVYTTASFEDCAARLHQLNAHFHKLSRAGTAYQMRGIPGQGFGIEAPDGFLVPWGQK